jgi:microcystin-dependent protein
MALVEVRRNLSSNPKLGTSTSGWSGSGGTGARVNIASAGVPNMSFAYQRSGNTIASAARVYVGIAGLTIGETYTASALVYLEGAVAGSSWQFRIVTTTSGTTGTIMVNAIAERNSWVRLTGTFVAAAETMYLTLRRAGTTGTASDNEVFAMTGVVVEQGVTSGEYYDGSIAPSGFTAAWSGSPEISTSILYREGYVRAADQMTLTLTATPSYIRSYYLLQDSTLPAPAAPTSNPPAAPWSTTEPAYTPGSTMSRYRVQLTVWGDASFEYGPVTLDQAFEISKAAYNAALAAQNTAATADGRLTVSAASPITADGAGKAAGSVWFRKNGVNQFIEAWEWTGSAWQSRAIENAMIATLDAAKINTGFLNSDRVEANSLSVRQLLVSNLTNLLEDSGFEVPLLTTAWMNINANVSRVTTNTRSGGGALRMAASTSAYDGLRQKNAMAVQPGEVYRFSAWVRREGANHTVGAVELSVAHGATEASTTATTAVASSPAGMSNSYVQISGTWTVPADTFFARLRIVMRDTSNVNAYTIDDVFLQRQADANLIVDGGIKARNLDVTEIWSNSAFINNAKINVLTAGSIDGMVITGATLQTNSGNNVGIKIDATNGFRAFDENGEPVVSITQWGAVSVDGILNSKTTYAGSSIIEGATIQFDAVQNTVHPAAELRHGAFSESLTTLLRRGPWQSGGSAGQNISGVTMSGDTTPDGSSSIWTVQPPEYNWNTGTAIKATYNEVFLRREGRDAPLRPAGEIIMFGGGTSMTGYLECNGQQVSRTQYAHLFAAIGTRWGAGDGSTTFNVPDLRGRAPMGLNASDSDFDTVGKTGGSKNHTHGMGDAWAQIVVTAAGAVLYRNKSGITSWTSTARVNGTSNSTQTSFTSGTTLAGSTEAGSSVGPFGTVMFLIKT